MEDGFRSFYKDILKKELDGVLPEELLKRYEIDSCLAHTEEKEIYLVTRRDDGLKGILRVTPDGASEDALAEYEILSKLHHPAIPKALDAFASDGRGYLVREFMTGQTLRSYVETYGPLGQGEIIDIAVELCDILQYLHSQTPPVIHRDIKPENIIIDTDGHTKLVDFGIARSYREYATSDTVAIGTRPYMAPEQFGGAQTDPRTDLYALGVVMVFMGTTSPDRTNLRHRYPFKALMPPVAKCVQVDPENRFKSGAALKRALLRIKHGGVRRLLLIGCGVVLVIALAGCSYWLGHRLAYRQAYEAGNAQGVETGYQQGYQKGLGEGYATGFTEGLEQIDMARLFQQDESSALYFQNVSTDHLGNTSGNLVNGGLCVTDDTHIYYSIPGGIGRMDMNGENMTLFCGREGTSLNLHGDYLYFIEKRTLYRAHLEGGTVDPLGENVEKLYIVGDTLYLTNTLDNLRLYRMSPDGTGYKKVSDQEKMYYLSIDEHYAYFSNGDEDNHLSRMDLQTGETELLDASDIHWVNVVGETIFYTMYGSQTSLLRMNTDGTGRATLSDASPAYTNVTPYGIFFASDYNQQQLYWMPLSGNATMRLVDARVRSINVAGQWVFFHNRDEGDALYRMRTDGSDLMRVSNPG